MRWFQAKFIAAQVRCFSGKIVCDLRQSNTDIDYKGFSKIAGWA
jgi:hypothetical protein